MERASIQYTNMASTLEKDRVPRSFSKNRLITSDIYWWCSGFYPGTLWYLYEYTGSDMDNRVYDYESFAYICHYISCDDYFVHNYHVFGTFIYR